MDYAGAAPPVIHDGWDAFAVSRSGVRLVLMSTMAAIDLWSFRFVPDDVILLGRESAGVPETVHAAAAARVRIPLAVGARALNVAVAGAVALAEARRQIGF
jgi:tRNA (cytidine/uridine-2'-O-)-methyltransferase